MLRYLKDDDDEDNGDYAARLKGQYTSETMLCFLEYKASFIISLVQFFFGTVQKWKRRNELLLIKTSKIKANLQFY